MYIDPLCGDQKADILGQYVGEVVLEGAGPEIEFGLDQLVITGAGDQFGLVEIIGQLDRADADNRIFRRGFASCHRLACRHGAQRIKSRRLTLAQAAVKSQQTNYQGQR